MPIDIEDLVPADQIQCWMRLGFAIKPAITGKGKPYYRVPSMARAAGPGDLTRFYGWVVSNSPEERLITVQVSPFNSWQQSMPHEPRQLTVSYEMLQRVRILSKYSHAPMQEVPASYGGKGYKRPGSIARGTNFKPYRLVEEVRIRR